MQAEPVTTKKTRKNGTPVTHVEASPLPAIPEGAPKPPRKPDSECTPEELAARIKVREEVKLSNRRSPRRQLDSINVALKVLGNYDFEHTKLGEQGAALKDLLTFMADHLGTFKTSRDRISVGDSVTIKEAYQYVFPISNAVTVLEYNKDLQVCILGDEQGNKLGGVPRAAIQSA